MNEKKGLLKNIASLSIVQIANYVFPLITVPVISRIIGPDKFGVINYATAFVAYFVIFIGYGFDLTATRKIAAEPDSTDLRNKVFSEVLYAQILLFTISVLIFGICLNYVPLLKSEKLVAYFTFLGCISIVFTQNWLFQAMQDLPKVAWLNFTTKLLFTITIFLIIKKKEDYIWQPLVVSLVQITVGIISFVWAFEKYKLKFIKIDYSEVFNLLKNEKIAFFSLIIISLYTTTNIVVLGIMESKEQVGYYTAGQKLIDIIRSVVTLPLSMALFPFIGKAFGKSLEKGLMTVQKTIPLIIIFTGTIGVCILFLGPPILRFFYGNKFDPAIPVFQILSFIPMIIALSNILGIQIMINLKMDRLFFSITSIGAALSIILNVLLVRKLGYIGSSICWLSTEIFITSAMYISLRYKGINPIAIDKFNLFTIKEQINPVLNKIFKYNA